MTAAQPAPICPEQARLIAEEAIQGFLARRYAGHEGVDTEDVRRDAAAAALEISRRVATGWTPQCDVSDVLARQAADLGRLREERARLLVVLEAARARVERSGTGFALQRALAAYDRLADETAGAAALAAEEVRS